MKLNRKGFTLIELLAVITILGILMIVGIPAVQRTINNSRRDTFLDTAKEYANSVKTAWAADEIICTDGTRATGAAAGDYEIWFDTAASDAAVNSISAPTGATPTQNKERLIQSGGKSSWGTNDVIGYVKVNINSGNPKYYVYISDAKGHGTVAASDATEADRLTRNDIKDKDAVIPTTSGTICNIEE